MRSKPANFSQLGAEFLPHSRSLGNGLFILSNVGLEIVLILAKVNIPDKVTLMHDEDLGLGNDLLLSFPFRLDAAL